VEVDSTVPQRIDWGEFAGVECVTFGGAASGG
jgi:hypothetical protein